MTINSETPEVCVSPLRLGVSDVQKDWTLLDQAGFETPRHVNLMSHEQFTSCPGIDVEYVSPSGVSSSLSYFPRLAAFTYALKLLWTCEANNVLIINGSTQLWLFVGLLNRLLFRKRRRILCWDIFVEVNENWKRKLMSAALKGMTLSVLWSRQQIKPHSQFLGIPEDRFIFLPFKANHSKGPRYELQIDNFVFAGGNGKRDYRCLIDAVRGTEIPVIISATDPEVRKTIDPLPNVIVLGAAEPAFAQLQAASRFVVIPMINTGLKGGGEANFCNAMWHGKPIIAADSMAASDYILDGETGYVVPSGDSKLLRKRILELWNSPDLIEQMGRRGREHVQANFTHQAFIQRLLRLALLMGKSTSSRPQI